MQNQNRVRLQIRTRETLVRKLKAVARERDININELVELAVENYLTPPEGQDPAKILGRRIHELEQRQLVCERLHEAFGECMGLFIFNWFCSTPSPSEGMKSIGKDRYLRFTQLLKERIEGGRSYLGSLLDGREELAKFDSVASEQTGRPQTDAS